MTIEAPASPTSAHPTSPRSDAQDVADPQPNERVTQLAYTPFVQTSSTYTSTITDATILAWRVTIGAALVLATLVIGTPLVRAWYREWAIEVRTASMRSIDSVVFVQRQGSVDWIVAEPRDQVEEGDTVRTAVNARAFLQFFDGSTALVYPGTTMTVLRSQQSRFQPEKYSLILIVKNGRARIGVAPVEDALNAFVQVRVPRAEVHLSEGSYSVDVSKETSQVTTRRGAATGYVGGAAVTAVTGQRLASETGRAPIGGLPSRRDIVLNPVFVDVQSNTFGDWDVRDLSERDPAGTVTQSSDDGSVNFFRRGTGHGETLLVQSVDVDLWDFEHLVLDASFRIVDHSLSGGGWQGTEYPMMFRVVYRDVSGSVYAWTRGFYVSNRDGYPVRDATQVSSRDWQRFEIDLLGIAPRPWKILRVEVLASGWDYESSIKSFHLWAD